MKVTHVITTLGTGGAQSALHRLLLATRGAGIDHAVVSLTDEGTFGERLRALGATVSALGMRVGVPDPKALPRLFALFRRDRPDLVQGWMYHANLLAGLAAAPLRIPVVWGIRHAGVDPRQTKLMTRAVNALCARLSGVMPARVVSCAESALESHVGIGYSRARMMVIPNGFDVERFARDERARARVREELSIPGGGLVAGMLGRHHPDKGHDVLLESARIVLRQRPEVTFVLAGPDVVWTNPALSTQLDALGIRASFRLLGPRTDVPALLSAMDVLVSPSRTEAFSQVVGEAMSAGVPCAVTDCGDSREIVGTTGRVAPVLDPPALAAATLDLLNLPADERAALGRAARERIQARYALADVGQRWIALYRELTERGRAPRAETGDALNP
jgi:glycosyltransferase involved in cell wall biosynthesis